MSEIHRVVFSDVFVQPWNDEAISSALDEVSKVVKCVLIMCPIHARCVAIPATADQDHSIVVNSCSHRA
jgi:hypothetical protein